MKRKETVEFALPKQPIDRITEPFKKLLGVKSLSGALLITCACFALACANSPFAESYKAFWNLKVSVTFGDFQFRHSLIHLVNDGLMAIFFFVVGMEVKHELTHGALADAKRAALPVAAAIGGMVVPALVYVGYLLCQPTTEALAIRGWGIPMATDIAFVVGCLAVLGSRVPPSLRILLLSLAVVDDIGAIAVIAFGYTSDLDLSWLVLAIVSIVLVRLLAQLGVRRFPVYGFVGMIAWFAFHESGIHATIGGVVLGLMTPANAPLVSKKFYQSILQNKAVFQEKRWETDRQRAQRVRELQRYCRETVSPLEYLVNTLYPWSAFVIMPVFALANAGVTIRLDGFGDSVAVAIMLGLFLGKPLGIVLSSWLAVKLNMATKPDDLNWASIIAGSFLAGIGFTMALFIESLAFGETGFDTAKMGVLAGSFLSAMTGVGLLLYILPKPVDADAKIDQPVTTSLESS